MIQEMFPGKFPHADPAQIKASAAVAAGFVGLLSIFNMGGRIFWASMSDFLGRKTTYAIFFALGIALYASIPSLGKAGNLPLFIACYAVILSMYGGGFATIPAYLKDLFGTLNVGAIHGRLLTAWSAAGVAGPVLVNYIREYQIGHGVAKADAYSVTMYIGSGAGELYSRISNRSRRRQSRCLFGHDVHHGGSARRRIRLQLARHATR